MAKYLRYDFDNPHDPHNDRLVFSKGHASTLMYAMFRAAGAISEEELLTYRQFDSIFEGHPTPRIPWVDVATGSLGQGLPYAVGMAIAGKRLDRLPFRVWTLCGDSEIAEGSQWEALEHAAFYELDNLVAILDVNRLGQRGETMHGWDLDSYASRARAFGCHTIEIDGHDVEAIDRAYAEAIDTAGQPVVIVAKTIKGKGDPDVEDKNGFHGKALDHSEEVIATLGGVRNLKVDVAKPETGASKHEFPGGTLELPRYELGDGGRDAEGVRRRARRRSARRAATSSRSTARSRTPRSPRSSVTRSRSATSRCTSPSSRWSRLRSGCRCSAGGPSPRPSPRSSRAPTTSSACRRSAARATACAARTPASRSARTGRRRWRSRTSPRCAPSTARPCCTPATRTRPRSSWSGWPTPRGSSTCARCARTRPSSTGRTRTSRSAARAPFARATTSRSSARGSPSTRRSRRRTRSRRRESRRG